jgi:MoCo/4Fe-4S cofactor protein with predicted Tat translocation signal
LKGAVNKQHDSGRRGPSTRIGLSLPQYREHGQHWRSLEELADTPEFRRFLEAEFPTMVPGPDDEDGGARWDLSRRKFLKIMGASLALGGLAACRWPKEQIVPATRQPVNRVPGVPVEYASTMELSGVGTGVLVTSVDGRPIKIEGNPLHPFSRGKTNAWMQASVLDLYDPDRSRRIVQRHGQAAAKISGARPEQADQTRSWEEFQAFARQHFGELRSAGGAGLAVLAEPSSSRTFAEMRTRFQKSYPQARWYEYEPLSRDNEREGTRLAFGQPFRVHLQLEQTDVIVSLDCDFLGMHPAAVKYAGDFAARRTGEDGSMNRLYVFESNHSLTGAMADQRHALRSADVGLVLGAIKSVVTQLRGTAEVAASLPADVPVKQAHVEAIARELAAHRGRSLVVVGPNQPPEVHAQALALNVALRNVGQTLTLTADPEPARPKHEDALADLAIQMQAGAVQTLVILGGDPAHTAPGVLPLQRVVPTRGNDVLRPPDEMQSAGNRTERHFSTCVIYLGLYENRTSRLADWHVPMAHYLEAWGDARAYDGTVSLVQPLIDPLYGGVTPIELLALLIGDEVTRGYDLVRRTFQRHIVQPGPDFEPLWKTSLHDGVVPDTQWPLQDVELSESLPPIPPRADTPGYELVFVPDYSVYDGRFANNAWLQEMPDPLTKLTWDNAALISVADAQKLGIKQKGDMLRIEAGGKTLEIAACILPGHAIGSITLPVGYGAGPAAGAVAGETGFDTYALRPTDGRGFVTGAKVTATGKTYNLVGTQDHHAIDTKISREGEQERLGVIVREATLEHYREHPDFAQHAVHHPPLKSLWDEKEYTGLKWGMAIDLSKCIGCGACVVACQAENNVPVVGKDEVAQGREMHWLRVDRYFKGDPHAAGPPPGDGAGMPPVQGSEVQVVHQPMACAHCELAPCESVCPVAATVHDEEGLNVMVYNRCIGTRYCSNNCPFKVRRFNWFYNHHGPAHPRSRQPNQPTDQRVGPAVPGKLKQLEVTPIEQMQFNPDVTVRSRGVMEKCTYCTHRINATKIHLHNEHTQGRYADWPNIPDGAVTPACAQACPTDAIVFGNLNDPNSRIRRLQQHNRAYAVLAELNIKPRTQYLAKLRNPAEATGEPTAG